MIYLGIDKTECLQEVGGGDSLAASFMVSVEECASERECKLYVEGLRSKVKLAYFPEYKLHWIISRTGTKVAVMCICTFALISAYLHCT